MISLGITHSRITLLAFVVAIGLQACDETAGTGPAIVIDGRFEDWAIPTTVVRDSLDAPDGEIDLGEVRIVHDSDALFLLIDLGRDVNVQGLRGGLSLLLDTDGASTSGQELSGMSGVDLTLEFSGTDPARPGYAREGVAARPAARPEDPAGAPYDWDPAWLGLRFEPRHTSRRIELRIERGAEPPIPVAFLSGDRVRGKLVFRSETGVLVDETPVFSRVLDDAADVVVSSRSTVVSPFEPPDSSELRVVSWNVSGDDFLRYTDSFARVLGALLPDVVLLDEVPPEATPEWLRSFFSRIGSRRASTPGWHVLVGAEGGRQRGVIAARSPVSGLAEFERVPYPRSTLEVVAGVREEDLAKESWRALQEVAENAAGGGVPTLGGLVTRDQGRVFAVTLDLICCGNREGSPHDRVRRLETTAIHDASRRTLARLAPDAVIVGGDFNLVGSPDPLDLMAEGLDPDGSDLVVADALQLDGLSSATWESTRGPFPPGQLDYLLYSASSLDLLQAFVLDTRDVALDERGRLDLRETDTERASDHLPLVADFRWRDREAR
jgi:endonuclease/exonuclease/phosphatase family metal-dependent hydrolase